MTDSGPPHDQDPPQLHIFDATAREFELGTLIDGDETWQLFVIAERTSSDLCRGRLSFRHEDERYETSAILVEDSEQAVLQRAGALPASMLHQLLASVRE